MPKKNAKSPGPPRVLDMRLETVPIESLSERPENVNEGDVGAIFESLQTNGMYKPIVVQESTRTIIAGNHTYRTMVQAGAKEIPVIFIDVDDDAAIRDMLADNQTAHKATDNQARLAALLRRLAEETEQGLAGTGFDGNDLDDLIKSLGDGQQPSGGGLLDGVDPDALPEQVVTRCKPREIWKLGEHRMLVGDAFDEYDRNLLMASAKPALVFADPPYGMHLDTDYTKMPKTRVKPNRYDKVEGDDKDFNPIALIQAFGEVKEQLWWGGDYFYHLLPKGGSWIVWDKRNEASDGLVGNHFEVCWSRQHHRREMKRHLWSGFTARERDEKRTHPTQKPVALYEDLIKQLTAEGDVIVDPFLGSGTTIIAAQKCGRIVYGCEIVPALCDIILARWETATGKKAEIEVGDR